MDSTDSTVCNSLFGAAGTSDSFVTCNTRNELNCEVEFSDVEQAPWCAIRQPSHWAPLFDLSNGVDFAGARELDYDAEEEEGDLFGGGDESPAEEESTTDYTFGPVAISGVAQFAYTGQSDFGDAAMSRWVRTPDFALLATDAQIAAEVEVCLEPLVVLGVFRAGHALRYHHAEVS